MSWVAAEDKTKKDLRFFLFDLEDLGFLPAFGFKNKHRNMDKIVRAHGILLYIIMHVFD